MSSTFILKPPFYASFHYDSRVNTHQRSFKMLSDYSSSGSVMTQLLQYADDVACEVIRLIIQAKPRVVQS